jgi:hypothetical protein
MSASFNKPHLRINGFSESKDYKYPSKVIVGFDRKERNRASHGARILSQLNRIEDQLEIDKTIELPAEGLLKEDATYVQFYSDWNFKFDFDQFTDNRSGKFQLLNIQQEKNLNGQERYKILVLFKEGGISEFIKKVEEYLNPEKDSKLGSPKNEKLLVNIEDIQLATLEAFWTDGKVNLFPSIDEDVWWEVWFRKSDEDDAKILKQLSSIGATLGDSKLEFVENSVRLVKATAQQLASSLLFLDSLSELRKPQVINDFITHSDVTYQDQEEWTKDLVQRTHFHLDGDEVEILVCIFDSGINNKHPLLVNAIPDNYLETWKATWGKSDTEPNGGHGTGMAGLVLFGDLTEALASSENIIIFHGVESFKVYHPNEKTDPRLFGIIYQDGVNSMIVDRPKNKRVFCLAVTNDGNLENGRPSSSSSDLDNIIFGNLHNDFEPQLFIVSGGNIIINRQEDYPDINFISSIQDPGQAYNALTVGAYTQYNTTSDSRFLPLATSGAMSPFNRTSGSWETQWPNKPDVVFEGGNSIIHPSGFVASHDELSPISLDSNFIQNLFIPFNGTSSATAFASKMAAELRTEYPDFWPETIRGLMIHSADWTEAMMEDRNFRNSEADRRAILRSVGYGVPNLIRAKNSANNSLTLIAEEYIKPYQKLKGDIKYNEYHLYKLPWPKDVLLHEVAGNDAKITITLSYFIEANPGSRQYARSFSYHSHELDFKLIKSGETLREFQRRISAATEGEEDRPNLATEEWVIRERIRSKGSVKKDFLETSGAALADRFYLAIYPKNGWYRTRKKLEKYDNYVRYSLIISIETLDTNIDIYTPVANLVQINVPV